MDQRTINKILQEKGAQIKMISPFVGEFIKAQFKCVNGHTTNRIPYHALTNSICTKCICTNGFKTNKPAVFYAYEISGYKSTVIGFGITNNFLQRNNTHAKTFLKYKHIGRLIIKAKFSDGMKALKIESKIKNHKSITGIPLEGFKTECIPTKYKNFIIDILGSADSIELF